MFDKTITRGGQGEWGGVKSVIVIPIFYSELIKIKKVTVVDESLDKNFNRNVSR